MYSVVKKVDPRNPETSLGFYAQSRSSGIVRSRELARGIHEKCSLSVADVEAAIVALEEEIISHLLEGKIVRLGGIGDFRMAVKSEKASSRKSVTADKITGVRVKFRQGKEFARQSLHPEFRMVNRGRERQ